MVTWNPFAVSIAILCVMKLDFLFCCIGILGQEGYLTTWNKYLECKDPSFLLFVHTFSTALYHVSLPYLSNPSIWHQQMPYFAELIKGKTGYVIDSLWGFIDGMIRKTDHPLYNQ